MSGPEAPKPDDQLLDEFLASGGAVRTVYREAAVERAPAHLDAAILQAAQAVTRPMPQRRRPRWQMPMAAAAVVVLSFGVLLQVQRDPVAQKQVMSPPATAPVPAPMALPAPAQRLQDDAVAAGKAEAMAESEPLREETKADQKRVDIQPARKPASPELQRRRAAERPPAPPPPEPAVAMADAAPPAEALAAASQPTPSASRSATGAAATESMAPADHFAPAPAPAPAVAAAPKAMAKASRAPMAGGDGGKADAIEQWAQRCDADVPALDVPMQWRGLAVVAAAQQSDDQRRQGVLSFAPDIPREAISAALGSLAVRAALASSRCAVPVMRELRPSGGGWALVCECRQPAAP